jgi:4-amino-4-deoxy-L-arabinose transferase-like glycosyltransferase
VAVKCLPSVSNAGANLELQYDALVREIQLASRFRNDRLVKVLAAVVYTSAAVFFIHASRFRNDRLVGVLAAVVYTSVAVFFIHASRFRNDCLVGVLAAVDCTSAAVDHMSFMQEHHGLWVMSAVGCVNGLGSWSRVRA